IQPLTMTSVMLSNARSIWADARSPGEALEVRQKATQVMFARQFAWKSDETVAVEALGVGKLASIDESIRRGRNGLAMGAFGSLTTTDIASFGDCASGHHTSIRTSSQPSAPSDKFTYSEIPP